jgi:DNA-binding IclR family transcriptional regulator
MLTTIRETSKYFSFWNLIKTMVQEATETPTNLRTLLILEILGKSDRPMTATEINAELGLPKQTVHRLCVTLEEHGFITRPDNSRKYQVGRRLREIGAGLLYNSRDHITRRQILTDVAQEVGETVNYAVPRETGMDYLDRVETDWAFRIQLPIGSRVPFHCTASGKTFLASLPDRKLKGFLEAIDLRYMTSNTHVTKESLHAEIKAVRKNGYALDREEFMDDMVAIAVPVTDPQNRYIAALAFHGPTQRINIDDAVAKKDILQIAAKRISESLFS